MNPDFEIDPDISLAKTIPTRFYTDPSFFESGKEKIFFPSWQFVGSTSLISEPGSCYPFIFLDPHINEPLLLAKNQENKISCLSNVCTHRGNLLVKDACTVSHIRCRYHGRIFDLDGKFRSMPEFKEVKNFPSAEDDLHKLPLFQWGNLLFCSLTNSFSAEKFLGEMMNRVGWLPLEEFKFRADLSRDYIVHAHWALYCENYLEGFHIPFVHAGLNAVLDFGNYTTEIFSYSNLQLGIAKEGELCFELPASSQDFGKNIAAYYFWVFSNMMFNFYPWGLSVNIVMPVSTGESRVRFLTFVWKESLFDSGAGADLNSVEMEDEEVVEAVQKGVRSRFYSRGRYSVTREQGTHHFHRLLSSFLK